MELVANVIVNRRNDPRRWPNNIAGVAQQRAQFSAWNARDPNRARMLRVTEADAQFRVALEIARQAVAGTLPDHSRGANHFHTHRVRPPWSRGRTPVLIYRGHRFFRL
jgi:spore germination cell wall hydrolase CwlJ-like protein